MNRLIKITHGPSVRDGLGPKYKLCVPHHAKRSFTETLKLHAASSVQTNKGGHKSLISPRKPSPILKVFEFLDVELRWVRHYLSVIVSSRRDTLGLLTKQNRGGSDVLDSAASYLLESPGKLIRPALVLLLSYCCILSKGSIRNIKKGIQGDITNLKRVSKVQDTHNSFRRDPIADYNYPKLPHNFQNILILASVTELIHVASLLHDDVIDNAKTRRGRPSLAELRGPKVAVLAGDYLFSRACGLSTLLGSMPVVRLMSSALEELVRGELLQMDGALDKAVYFEKNHRKTGSLLEKSLSASMIALQRSTKVASPKRGAKLGVHLGQAFQIIDDCLDFTGSEAELGKAKFADLKEGIMTLPVLLAAEKNKKIAVILRQNMDEQKVEKVIRAVESLGTVKHAQDVAKNEFKKAMDTLRRFPKCESRLLLEDVAKFILNRHS